MLSNMLPQIDLVINSNLKWVYYNRNAKNTPLYYNEITDIGNVKID